MTLTFKIQIWP